MTKTKTFKKADGSEGTSYFPENKDKYKVLASKVMTFSHPAIVKNKAVIIENHTIKVENKDGKEIFLTISKGQKKVLDKVADLTGRIISFEMYDHKEYGKLLGARVEKETKTA